MADNEPLIEYLDPSAGASRFANQGRDLDAVEYAVVRNLGYVFAPDARGIRGGLLALRAFGALRGTAVRVDARDGTHVELRFW